MLQRTKLLRELEGFFTKNLSIFKYCLPKRYFISIWAVSSNRPCLLTKMANGHWLAQGCTLQYLPKKPRLFTPLLISLIAVKKLILDPENAYTLHLLPLGSFLNKRLHFRVESALYYEKLHNRYYLLVPFAINRRLFEAYQCIFANNLFGSYSYLFH